MPYQGFFINLDRCIDRRIALENELTRLGLRQRYQRLRAADGNEDNLASPLKNPAEIGCFLSHIRALRQGLEAGKHLHLIEDDTVFAPCTEQTLLWAMTSGELDRYDILFTDIAMPLANESYRFFKLRFDQAVARDEHGNIASARFHTFDLRDVPFLSASSYLVNKNAFALLNELYAKELAEGIRIPVDLFFRNQAKVGALKIGCLFPFVTSVHVEETLTSTVRRIPDLQRKFIATNIGRYSFFVGCDWDLCNRLMHAYIPRLAPDDKHARLLSDLLAFSLLEQL